MWDLLQGEESRANNNKYLIYQKKIFSDQIKKLSCASNLKGPIFILQSADNSH